jgi:hypothetical protein
MDLLVLREPVVNLPKRTVLGERNRLGRERNPRSGLARLQDFSVITALKVATTQVKGLGYTKLVEDFEKLSSILNAAHLQYADGPAPGCLRRCTQQPA